MKQNRYLLEGCAIDPLLDDEKFLALVIFLYRKGMIDVFVTDLTYNDIDQIKNEGRCSALRAVISQINPEVAFYPAVLVGGKNKRDRLTLLGNVVTCDEVTMQLLFRLKSDGRADARQAAAAKMIDATLVTNDQGLISRSLAEGINAITTDQWRMQLTAMN